MGKDKSEFHFQVNIAQVLDGLSRVWPRSLFMARTISTPTQRARVEHHQARRSITRTGPRFHLRQPVQHGRLR
jgi:hypothetical protein